MYLLIGKPMLPYGRGWSVFLLWVCAHIGGFLAAQVRSSTHRHSLNVNQPQVHDRCVFISGCAFTLAVIWQPGYAATSCRSNASAV